jgi:hypothetical protein
MTAVRDKHQCEFRARRRYARSLKYRDPVCYTDAGETVEAPFLAFVNDGPLVCLDAGNSRKYLELNRLVLPAAPPKQPKPKKAKPAREASPMPAAKRRKLGLM